MPSYLVPGPPDEPTRNAIADVAAMLEVGDENREDEAFAQEERRREDAEWDKRTDGGADGLESASTTRILDAYHTLREQRGGGADVDDDLSEVSEDEEALAGLPGGDQHSDDLDKRTARAVQSVAEVMRAGVVVHDDEDAAEVVSPDDYEAFDRECLSDFPDYAKPVRQAPAPAPIADDGDDGFDEDRGPYEGPRRASSPPSFTP